MNKKRITALVAAGMIGISALAIAMQQKSKPAYALSTEEARLMVADVLPDTVEHTGTDEDDEQATFEYFDAKTKTLYEVKVDLKKAEISNIREYKMDQELIPFETSSSSTARTIISRDEARDIALDKVAGANAKDIREFELDDRNERDAKYEVDIVYDGYKYELEINAHTGAIQEFEREAAKKTKPTTAPATAAPTTAAPTTVAPVTAAPTTVSPATTAPATSSLLTADEAMEIALARVPGATRDHIREFELDHDDGRPEYEGEIRFNGVEYEFEINARNGNVFKWEVDRDDDGDDDRKHHTQPTTAPARATQSALISRDRAIEIALAKVSGATRAHVEDAELDEDDGRYEWEIEIEIGDYEYEIDIDARNGKILDIEIDD